MQNVFCDFIDAIELSLKSQVWGNITGLRYVEDKCNPPPKQTDRQTHRGSSCHRVEAKRLFHEQSSIPRAVCHAVLTLLIRPLKRTSSAFSCCTRSASSSWQPSLSCRSCNTSGRMKTLSESRTTLQSLKMMLLLWLRF